MQLLELYHEVVHGLQNKKNWLQYKKIIVFKRDFQGIQQIKEHLFMKIYEN